MPWISGPKLTTSWNATGDRQWGTLIGEEYAHTYRIAFTFTLYTLTSIGIFSILFSLHFLRC